jgi:hypothetical protein
MLPRLIALMPPRTCLFSIEGRPHPKTAAGSRTRHYPDQMTVKLGGEKAWVSLVPLTLLHNAQRLKAIEVKSIGSCKINNTKDF